MMLDGEEEGVGTRRPEPLLLNREGREQRSERKGGEQKRHQKESSEDP